MQANKALLLSNMLSSTNSVENADIAKFEASCVTPLDITVDIDPVQDLHGYGNPWPAGGGKNKLRMPYSDRTGKTENGITYSVESNGSLRASGTSASQSNFYLYGNNGIYEDIKLPSGTYTFSINADGTFSGIQWFCVKSNGTILIGENLITAQMSKTIEIDSSETYRFFVRVLTGNTVNTTIKLQIESGSTVTSWTPYSNICPISGWTKATISHSGADTSNPTEYEIPFSTEVYGGKLNVETGKMVVTKKCIDMGDLSYSKNTDLSTADRFSCEIADLSPVVNASTIIDAISSVYVAKGITEANNNTRAGLMAGLTKMVYFYENVGTYADANAFKTARTGKQFVYKLATPITLTLTPVEIRSLIGDNNVWADTGNVSVRNITCNADFLELLLKTKLIGEC